MDFRKHWDQWGWVIAATFICIAAAGLFWGKEPFCTSQPEEHCLREWVSAAGSILAAMVALPPLIYLGLQTAAAERHHRESLHNTRRENLALAASIENRFWQIEAAGAQAQRVLADSETTLLEKAREVVFALKRLEEFFAGDLLKEMELRINPVAGESTLYVMIYVDDMLEEAKGILADIERAKKAGTALPDEQILRVIRMQAEGLRLAFRNASEFITAARVVLAKYRLELRQ
ncbi:hypothetical protein [Shinella kummerowiae]|uniref:hypothetical protein n=1 Tax=Shinella kummerowiae TaxID=417745 RepID=UPI0021B61C71|nr:hypothetical protein [Shinella kummerowiae]MCT7662344.1 hypothetical protein [Shinella kummerowiae]